MTSNPKPQSPKEAANALLDKGATSHPSISQVSPSNNNKTVELQSATASSDALEGTRHATISQRDNASAPIPTPNTAKRLDDHTLQITQAVGAIMSTLAIILSLSSFFWQRLPEQENQARIQNDLSAWTIINSAQGQRASGGRIQAMHVLATDGESMAGLRVRSAVLTGVDVHGADLHGADLSNTVLNGANLAYANLKGANLQNTQLMAANLTGADLSGANLQGASLFNVSLIRAILNYSHLEKGDVIDSAMQGASLMGVHWKDVNLLGDSLQGVNMFQADMRGAHLTSNMSDANLVGAYLQGANLSNANLQNANLDYVNLQHSISGQALISNGHITAVIEGADISHAFLMHAQLNGAFLLGVNLRGANLQNANLTNTYLYGSDVQEAKLSDAVGLTPSDVTTTKNWRDATYTGRICGLLPLPRYMVSVEADQSVPYPASTPVPTLVTWAPSTPGPEVWPTSTAVPRLNLPPLSSHDLTAIANSSEIVLSRPSSLSTPYVPLYRYIDMHVEQGC